MKAVNPLKNSEIALYPPPLKILKLVWSLCKNAEDGTPLGLKKVVFQTAIYKVADPTELSLTFFPTNIFRKKHISFWTTLSFVLHFHFFTFSLK